MFGDFDPGQSTILPILQINGVEHLDVLAISHPDPDHILGAFSIIDQMPIKEIWHSGFSPNHVLTKRLIKIAKKKNIVIKNTQELLGQHFFGETLIEVLAPHTGTKEIFYEELGANDNSLVLKISFQNKSLLWPGDIEYFGEMLLLSEDHDLTADILKAPHHGSKTSSSLQLIERVNPKFVIFSTGRDNRFDFPHKEISKRYHEHSITSFNTAIDGQITMVLNHQGILISGFKEKS